MSGTPIWYLGTMGFSWKDWIGPFYPQGMIARDFLGYYSRIFDAVEIDSSFYGSPRPEVINRWDSVTPAGFKICLKMPKSISHTSSLTSSNPELDSFIKAAISLGDKLGAILIQFPPSFDISRLDELDAFLGELPSSLRFAVETRHASWFIDQAVDMFASHSIAWASTEYEALPRRIYQTADFLYFRLIGHHGSFKPHDRERMDVTQQLEWWRENLQPYLSSTQAVYGFFNNDYAGFGVGTLNRFKTLVGLEVKPLEPPEQPKLF